MNVQGVVLQTQGSTWRVQDATGNIEITKAQDKATALPAVKKGTKVKVTGRVARTKIGTRVVPRTNADIEVQESTTEGEAFMKDQEIPLLSSYLTPDRLLPVLTASFASTGTLLLALCALYGKDLFAFLLKWFMKGLKG